MSLNDPRDVLKGTLLGDVHRISSPEPSKETQNSSSAGVILLDNHPVKAYTRRQKIIARSRGITFTVSCLVPACTLCSKDSPNCRRSPRVRARTRRSVSLFSRVRCRTFVQKIQHLVVRSKLSFQIPLLLELVTGLEGTNSCGTRTFCPLLGTMRVFRCHHAWEGCLPGYRIATSLHNCTCRSTCCPNVLPLTGRSAEVSEGGRAPMCVRAAAAADSC